MSSECISELPEGFISWEAFLAQLPIEEREQIKQGGEEIAQEIAKARSIAANKT